MIRILTRKDFEHRRPGDTFWKQYNVSFEDGAEDPRHVFPCLFYLLNTSTELQQSSDLYELMKSFYTIMSQIQDKELKKVFFCLFFLAGGRGGGERDEYNDNNIFICRGGPVGHTSNLPWVLITS